MRAKAERLTIRQVAKKSFSAGFNAVCIIVAFLVALVDYSGLTSHMLSAHKLSWVLALSVLILCARVVVVVFGFYRDAEQDLFCIRELHATEVSRLNSLIEALGVTLHPVSNLIKHDVGTKPLIVLDSGSFEVGQILSLGIDLGGGIVQLGLAQVKGVNEEGKAYCELDYVKEVGAAQEYVSDATRVKDMRARSIIKHDDLVHIYKIEVEKDG